MPQEMNILCCYSCKMYQVHIVKKAPKWNCKIYFQGSGRDCRLQVQQLNAMKANDTFFTPSGPDDGACDTFANISGESDCDSAGENKWTTCIRSSEIEGFEDVEDLVFNNAAINVTSNVDSESEDVDNETEGLRTTNFNHNSNIDDKCNMQDNTKPNEDYNNVANIFETCSELDDPLDF
ncbi:uncharacterized protein LOC114930742 isoform X2 [Nylanderia fulva]|uniref:uncharacterized protein LOC114930742 isoform X2 n=1 Tax=Nylanderia fulva TaxID=613905 RepID=UPI0010FAF2A6|nr:uncharacterized protein LOC114930742 isoform X2 [Nylanderia fulva]